MKIEVEIDDNEIKEICKLANEFFNKVRYKSNVYISKCRFHEGYTYYIKTNGQIICFLCEFESMLRINDSIIYQGNLCYVKIGERSIEFSDVNELPEKLIKNIPIYEDLDDELKVLHDKLMKLALDFSTRIRRKFFNKYFLNVFLKIIENVDEDEYISLITEIVKSDNSLK